ncbi:MAG: translation initiation factor IF-3 [Erysipelotrichia bacterium]|jgi:translation initiation factor IF-3|nr:translation initiation factor IF-3 [Bacilli bacterium]NLB49662.1 translation initiation factor IF-3 [Erysipelotrichia bacterium]
MIIANYPTGFNKKPNTKNTDLINGAIRFPRVLLIGSQGEQLGTMTSREAQFKANEAGLDLLCVAPNANPPVCKLIDYGRFRYEQQKKAKIAKKNQHIVAIKEVQLTPQIGFHDMETKARNATGFLKEGNKVKVGVRFRGRQLAHPEVGEEVIKKFIEMLSEFSTVEKTPSMDGRWLVAILAPRKKKEGETPCQK